jgi:hypothetical protein
MLFRMLLRRSWPFLLVAVFATLAGYAEVDLRLFAGAACIAAVVFGARVRII